MSNPVIPVVIPSTHNHILNIYNNGHLRKLGIKTKSNSKLKTTTNCHARNMSVVRQKDKPKKMEA